MALLRNTRITAYPGRNTHHDGIGWHVARHYSAGADHGPFADGEPGQNGRVGPNRGALPDPRVGQFVLVFLAARRGIVRERCVWPNENIVLHLNPIPELNAAFHCYAIADGDVIFDKSVVANVTFRTNVGSGK